MLTDEVIEIIIRADSAGIFTDEQRINNPYMSAVADKTRAIAIQQSYSKNKRINSAWIQSIELEYIKEAQESDCYVMFKSYTVLTLDDKRDGYIYIGSNDGLCEYRKIKNRGDLNMYSKHRITKLDGSKTIALTTGETIEVYGNTDVKECRIDGIFSSPTKLPNFNKDYDEYPISPELIPIMQEIIIKLETSRIYAKPIDSKTDSADTHYTTNK